MNKQDVLNNLAEKKRVTVPVAAAEDWAGKARMSESGDCSCIKGKCGSFCDNSI